MPVVVVYPVFETVNSEYGVPVTATGIVSTPFLMTPTLLAPTITFAPSTFAGIAIQPCSLPGGLSGAVVCIVVVSVLTG